MDIFVNLFLYRGIMWAYIFNSLVRIDMFLDALDRLQL